MADEIRTLPGMLRTVCAEEPNRILFIVDGKESLSVRTLEHRSNALARGLIAIGVRPGDRVGLCFDALRLVDCTVSYFGIQKTGSIAVPVAPERSEHTDRILQQTTVSGIICPHDLRLDAFSGWQATPQALEHGHSIDYLDAPVKPDDLSVILFSSGTTGPPKGITCRHDDLTYLFRYHRHPNSTPAPSDRIRQELSTSRVAYRGLIMQDFAPASLRMVQHPLIFFGETDIVIPNITPERAFSAIDKHNVVIAWISAPLAQNIAYSSAYENYQLSSLRTLASGFSRLPPAIVPRLKRLFPNAQIINQYGTNEIHPAATEMVWDARRPDSIGLPVRDTELRIVDERGRVVPHGEDGEMCFRYAGLPQRSYYNDPNRSSIVFQEGWTRTGDIGYIDSAGYVYLRDRADDVIVRGAQMIHSGEIEDILFEHDRVREAAVFAVADDYLGEEIACAVVAHASLTAQELKRFVRDRLGVHKTPRIVTLVDELPRNERGKVLKRKLRGTLRAS